MRFIKFHKLNTVSILINAGLMATSIAHLAHNKYDEIDINDVGRTIFEIFILFWFLYTHFIRPPVVRYALTSCLQVVIIVHIMSMLAAACWISGFYNYFYLVYRSPKEYVGLLPILIYVIWGLAFLRANLLNLRVATG